MADEDLLPFDPTMKKKKKKKKTGFDLDAAMGDDSGAATDGQPSAPVLPVAEEEQEPEPEIKETKEAVADDILLDFTNMKKKKKKKKAFDLEDMGEALPETTESEVKETTVAPAVDDDLGDLDFSKKKKKKKKIISIDGGTDDLIQATE